MRRLRTVLDDGAELGVAIDLQEPARALEVAVQHALEGFLDGDGDANDVARLLDVLALLGTDRPLPRVLPLVARCAQRAFSDKAFATTTERLLPALEKACRSHFSAG